MQIDGVAATEPPAVDGAGADAVGLDDGSPRGAALGTGEFDGVGERDGDGDGAGEELGAASAFAPDADRVVTVDSNGANCSVASSPLHQTSNYGTGSTQITPFTPCARTARLPSRRVGYCRAD
jgi:hypothetical protein